MRNRHQDSPSSQHSRVAGISTHVRRDQREQAIDAFRRRGVWPIQWQWVWLADGGVGCLELQRDGMWHVVVGRRTVAVVRTKAEAFRAVREPVRQRAPKRRRAKQRPPARQAVR